MARRYHDQQIHPPCGAWRPDAFNPETDGEWMVDDDEHVCEACAELDRWRKDNPSGPGEGVQVQVRRLTPAELERREGSPPRLPVPTMDDED